MKSFAVPLAFLLAVCGLVQVSDGKCAREKINEYLEGKVDSEDVGANLAAAEEYLKQLNQKITQVFGSDRTDLLELFLSMKDALNQCDEDSFQVFDDVMDKWCSASGRGCRVAIKAKNEHMENCLPHLKEQVASKIASVEPRALELMRGYTDIAIKYIQIIRVGESLLKLLQKDVVGTRNTNYNQEVLAFVQNQEKADDPQSVGSKPLKALAFKYVIQPCAIYKANLETEKQLWTRLIKNRVEMDEDLVKDIYRAEVCDYLVNGGQSILYNDLEMLL